MHILYNDTIDDSIKTTSNVVKQSGDTIKFKKDTIDELIIALIKQNDKITANEIGENLGISLSTTKRKMKFLKEQRIIEHIGSTKFGYWKIIAPKDD